MDKKYELTEEQITAFGKKVYRIRYLKEVRGIHAGELGGYVESEYNLSQYDYAVIKDYAVVKDSAVIKDYATIGGYAEIGGSVVIGGHVVLDGHAYIKSDDDIVWFEHVGSENGTLTAFRDTECGIRVTRGCFSGSLTAFEEAVEKTHGDNKYAKEYKMLIEYIKVRFEVTYN